MTAKERHRRWRATSVAYVKARLKYRYGITLEELTAAIIVQNGECGVCHRPPERGNPFAVDHDHTTGRFRGLLHRKCNAGLAFLGDDAAGLQRALEYVQ